MYPDPAEDHKRKKRAASAVWPQTWRAHVSSVVRACARHGRFLSLLLPVDQRAGGGAAAACGRNKPYLREPGDGLAVNRINA